MDQNLDQKALKEIEEVLNTNIYPGTEIMKDVGTHHFVKASSAEDSVLVPQPSDDKHDPLNWSPMWKACTIFCATMITFAQGLGPLANAPMFGNYIQQFDSDLEGVIAFTGVTILVLGFSNFIWVPVQTCFGRRPVMILSSVICVGASIWRAKATSYGSYMGASVLHGLGAGPAETAQPTIIADVIFLHDRGKYQTLYFAFYFAALTLGPIIAGPMAQNYGPASFWWFNTALLIFTTVCCIFLFPETRYHRPTPDAFGARSGSPGVKGQSTEVTTSETERATKIFTEEKPSTPSSPQDPWLNRGRPSKQQWKLTQSYEGNFFQEIWLPWKLWAFPIVQFAAFVVSFSASDFLVVNITQTQAFAAPPYGFGSSKIGLFNLATFTGTLIGLFTAGPLSDAIAARLTKRSDGIREPEMRLLAMVPYTILMVVGNIVVALGYQKGWDWKIIVIIGYTLIGIQVAALPAISSTYAIDSYKPVTGAIFVMITVNKNVWGYGITKFVTPWIVKDGYVAPILTNMALTLFFCGSAVVFWYMGKRFRGWTKDSKVHLL